MPLAIFNLSKVDHLYIGRNTVIAFTEEPTVDTYNIELASEDKIKEHLAKPRNWVPQRHETLPEIPHDTALFVLQQMYQNHARCNCRIKPSPQILSRNLRSYVKNMERLSPRTTRTLAERTKLVKMDIDTGDSPPVSSRPYTLPLKHYKWVQREIESLECAGVITKIMSKWASPIVVFPKKSAPGEPPEKGK